MRGEEQINSNPNAKSFSYQKAEVKEGWIQSFRDQLFYFILFSVCDSDF